MSVGTISMCRDVRREGCRPPSLCVPFTKLGRQVGEDTNFDKLATQVGLLQITSLQSCNKFRLRNKEIQRISHLAYQRPLAPERKVDVISLTFISIFCFLKKK